MGTTKSGAGVFRVYGTFLLGGAEFALEASRVEEVIAHPARLLPVPEAPPHVTGAVTRRGRVLPVVDVGGMLGLESRASGPRRIVVVAMGGMRMGLVFDAIHDIVRVHGDDEAVADPVGGVRARFFAGMIKAGQDQRPVTVLRVEAWMDALGVEPGVESQDAASSASPAGAVAEAGRQRCVVFRVGEQSLALASGAIREIIGFSGSQPSAFEDGLCRGMLTHRGQILPLLDIASLLGIPKNDDPVAGSSKKIIVMDCEGHGIAWLIDAVESLEAFAPVGKDALPAMDRGRPGLVAAYVPRPDGADVMLVDHGNLLQNPAVVAVARGHAKVYPSASGIATDRKPPAAKRNSYIAFRLDHVVALPITAVQEIIPQPPEFLPSPGSPPHVLGMVDLRGQLVTVVAMRRVYGLAPREATGAPILVMRKGDALYGLVVDAVDGIIAVNHAAKIGIPRLIGPDASPGLREDSREAVEPHGDFPLRSVVLLMDGDAMMARVAKSVAA